MKRIILLFLLAALAGMGFAAAGDYSFSYSSGTYTEITGGTVLSTITSDDSAENFALPFGFTYDGIRYFYARVSANGWLKLYNGTAPTDTDYSNNIGGTGLLTALCPLFDDLNPTGTPAAVVRYELFGTVGDRILVIQWKDIKWYGSSGTPQNFQIQLHENGNVIHFVYGTMNTPAGSPTASIGIVDATGGIGNFLSVTPATAPTASSEVADNSIAAITYLTSGTTYTFTPPAPSAAPNAAILVSPADAAPAVYVSTTLNWADGGGWTEGFKLLFSPTSSFPPATPTDLGYVTTYDPPGDLDPLTPYSWKVIPYNTVGGDNVPAAAWTFTTASLPLTGTKVIGSTEPYDYLTFTEAITSLNAAGVGTGGVTFTVQDGTYAENPPAITASGTADNPVVFEPVTGANPVLTPTGGTGTFGFKLDGADYVTFDNIDITAGGTLIYGYWLANGADNCTVQNATITMPYGSTNYAILAETGSNAPSILDNTIASNTYYGIRIYGTSSVPIQDAVVQGNVLSGIRNYGLYLYYVQNAVITDNNIACQEASTVAFYGIYLAGSSTNNSTVNVSYNTISGGYTGNYSIYGIYNYYSSGSFDHNTISNLYNTGSSSWYGFYDYYGGTTSWTNNTITGITNTGTGTFYGLESYYSVDATWSDNEVSNVTITSGSLYGVYVYYGTTRSFHDNLITGLVGTGTVYGCYVAGGTTANVYNNTIHNLVSNGTSTAVTYGVYISSGTTNNIYNNFVYDLRNPGGTTAGQVRGIYLAGGTTTNVWNNTVYLNTSGTNANFTTAALYVGTSSTSYSFDLKNNIFVNASTAGSSGWTVAFYKSDAAITNVSTGSDKNIYYAGGEEPGARDVIGYFGTTSTYTTYATLDDYKAFAAPRDAGSYSENVPFVSSRLIDLHIDDSVPTRVEGNAIPITEVSFDIDNQTREATPDIGADEGSFTGIVGVPGNVTLVSPANGSENLDPDGLTVTWSAPSTGGTPAYYEVYVSSSFVDQDVDDFFGNVAGQQRVDVPTTSLDISTISGLDLGYLNGWYWAVVAYNNGDEESDIYDPSFMVWGFSTAPQMQADDDLALGDVYPENVLEGTITVTNIGPDELTFTAGGSDEFRFGIIRYAIPAGQSVELPYEFFAPATLGAYSGTITLTETSPGESVINIGVTANITTDIYFGTGTSNGYMPIYPNYGYSYSQAIYPAEWFNYPDGYRIEKIYYDYNYATAPANTQDFKIWMGHTTLDAFASSGNSWLPVDQMTLVYDGVWSITDGLGWKEITLQVPFEYNQTDNLVIAVDENTPGDAGTSSARFNCTYTSGEYHGISQYSDTANVDPTDPTQASPTARAYYPNTGFFVAPVPTVPEIAVSPESWDFGTVIINTTNTKEFTIRNTGGGDLVISNISVPTGLPVTLLNLPTFPVTLNSANSTQTFTVQYAPTAEGMVETYVTIDDNLTDVTVEIDGNCVDPRIASLPHAEYFDDVTTPALPLGWTGYVNSTSTYAVVATYNSTTYAQSAPNSARLYNSSDASADLRLISPQILVDMDAIRLKFYARGLASDDFVLIGTTDAPDGSGSFNQLASLSLTTTKTEYTYELDDYTIPTGHDRICFKLGTGASSNYAYIDNFILEEIFTVPTLYVNPSEWNYGDVELSNPSSKVFQLSNLGTGTITITSGDIYTNNPEFTVDATYPIALTYGNPPVDVTVTFTPANLGARTATLSIDDNVGAKTVHTYSLSGNGVAEPPMYTALYAEVENINDVVLNWGAFTLPAPATEGYLHYDNGTNSSGVGSTSNPANFDVAIKLETAVLEDWAGMDITQIRFYPYSADATYTLKVWTGSDGSLAPTTEVRSIPVTPTTGAWNEVNLANPYQITAAEAIWIGYNCDVAITGSVYPAGADAGPAVMGFGDLLNLGGEWYSLSANSSINRNWNIQAYVDEHVVALAAKPEDPGIPVINSAAGNDADKSALASEDFTGQPADARGIMGFNIYRDGSTTPLNPALLTAYTYTDLDLSAGLYEYTVQAVQYDQTGPMSNLAEALVPGNDLAATAIASPEFYGNVGSPIPFNVTVYNNGLNTQSAYRVRLMNADGDVELAYADFSTPIASDDSEVLTVNWSPLAAGTYQVYGEVYFAGDQIAANNACYSMEMYVISATMSVIGVGDEASTTSSYSYPLNYYYKNSLTEELYFTDEMHLTSGTITAIVYRNTFTSNLSNKPVKIWMATTTDTDLTGNWKSVTYTQVFDGLVDFPSGSNYIVIPLSPAFTYTGNNLLTRVNRPMDTVKYTTSDKFYYTYTANHLNRTRYAYSDTETFIPLTPPTTSYTVSNVPNTWFVVNNPVMHPEAVLSGHVYIQGGSTPIAGATVTIEDVRYSTTTDENGYYEFRFWEAHTVDAAVAKFGYYGATQASISLPLGTPVTQNFYLTPLLQVSVSGTVTSNDYPTGLVGATVYLAGYDDYEVQTGTGGAFSIAGVYGNTAGEIYSVTVEKEGYTSYIGTLTVYESAVTGLSYNLVEYLWTPYNLVASHEGADARLNWDPAGLPDYQFYDF
ncbi:MAG TPA: choice-of-anchor D domain-containing protein, partial [Candidatus Syntrophosphaera sp.]|nr:choice-of-anchor D domain-containing protein [Candidatus Syntrophosphaera sp.]